MRKVSSAVLIPQKLSTSDAAGDVDSLPTPVAFNADPFIIVAVPMFVIVYKKQDL